MSSQSRSRLLLVLLLLCGLLPLPPVHAGPQNCSGDLCGRQFIPDKEQTGWGNFQRSVAGSWNDFNRAPGIRHANDLISGMANNLLGGIAAPLELAFGGWMQRNVWEPADALPQDFAPGPFDNLASGGLKGIDDAGLLIAGALRGGRVGDSPFIGRIGDDLGHATAALPRPVNPLYEPVNRSAAAWKHGRKEWINAAKAGDVEGMLTAKANPNRDLIKTINYSNTRHAAIQLERMAAEGPHNFVITPVGSRVELRVASQKGVFPGEIREFGVKHIQVANGKPIHSGGTMYVTLNKIGEPTVRIVNDTGTYGPRMPMTPERVSQMVAHVYDAFLGQVSRQNILFEAVTPR